MTILKPLSTISLTVIVCMNMQNVFAQENETIEVTSSAFSHNTDIPLQYSAYGDNISPDLSWGNLPAGTQELALILDDPVVDMPQPFVHWVAYNIPATATGLPEAIPTDAVVSVDGLEGMINGLNGT